MEISFLVFFISFILDVYGEKYLKKGAVNKEKEIPQQCVSNDFRDGSELPAVDTDLYVSKNMVSID